MTTYRHVPNTCALTFPDGQRVKRTDEFFQRESYDPALLDHHLAAGVVELVDLAPAEPESDDVPVDELEQE